MSGRASPGRVLLRELGWRRAAAVAWDVARRRGGDPFAHLPPPADRRERGSRAQARPAILLYRALRRRLPPERAREVAFHVVEAGGVRHLRRTLGDVSPARFAELDPPTRWARVRSWLDRFDTATARVDAAEPERVAFTVEACALVRLCREAGHPELAPAFCRGDGRFFADQDPPVTLERPQTLAEGGAACHFTLRPEAPEPAARRRHPEEPGSDARSD